MIAFFSQKIHNDPPLVTPKAFVGISFVKLTLSERIENYVKQKHDRTGRSNHQGRKTDYHVSEATRAE